MIRWTQREWQLIAERLVHTHVDPNIHGWRHELVAAMRMVLPNDRWRDPTCLNNAKQILVPMMRMVVAKPPEKKELPPPQAPTAEQLSTEDLLVELARRIAKMMEAAKPLPVDRGFFPPASQAPKEECKKERPRILIIGPQPEQQHALEKQFPELCLRFVKAEEPEHLVVERGRSCHEVILWTKFMTHSQQAIAKKLPTWYAASMIDVQERLMTWATK